MCEQLKPTQQGSVKRYELGRGHFYLFIILLRSISFPPWSNTSHKHLEQVVDSNIFKPGGCGTVLSVTCNKIQTEEKKECLKSLAMTVNPEFRKMLRFYFHRAKNILLC